MVNNRPIRIRFATHGAALTVRNLLPAVTNELLEQVHKRNQDGKVFRLISCHCCSSSMVFNLDAILYPQAFCQFGPVERAIVVTDDRGRPTGRGIVEFANKAAARKALERCTEGALLLTT